MSGIRQRKGGTLQGEWDHGGNKQGTCLLRGRLSGFLLNNPHEKPQEAQAHSRHTCGIHLTSNTIV